MSRRGHSSATLRGATGQFGRLAVEELLTRGVPAAWITVTVRTPVKAAELAARGVTVCEADYDQQANKPLSKVRLRRDPDH